MMLRLATLLTVVAFTAIYGARAVVGQGETLPVLLTSSNGREINATNRGIDVPLFHRRANSAPAPDGQWQITVTDAHEILVERLTPPIHFDATTFAGPAPDVVWSADSSQATVIVVRASNDVALYHVAPKTGRIERVGRLNGYSAVSWSADGNWFTATDIPSPSPADADRDLLLYFLQPGDMLTTPFSRIPRGVTSLGWNPVTPKFAYGSPGGAVHILAAPTGESTTLPTDNVQIATWSPEGERMLLHYDDLHRPPEIWDGENFTPLPHYSGGVNATSFVIAPDTRPVWSDDGRWLAFLVTAPETHIDTLYIYDTAGDSPRLARAWESLSVRSFYFSADGRTFAYQSRPSTRPTETVLLHLPTSDFRRVDIGDDWLMGLGLP